MGWRGEERAVSDLERWWLVLGAVAAVVVLVAVLLGVIIAVAMRIDRRAGALWSTAKQVAGNTVPLWLLEQTNEELRAVRESTRALEHTLVSMNGRLEGLVGGDDSGSRIARKVRQWVERPDSGPHGEA